MSTGKSVDFPLPGLNGQQVILTERIQFSYELTAKYPSIKSFQSVHPTPAIYADTMMDRSMFSSEDKGETYFIEPLDLHS